MSRHFGLTSRSALGAKPPTGSLHGANSTRADLKSFYRLPSQSVLHDENVAHSPFEIAALLFCLIFLSAVAVALVLGFSILRFVGL